MTKVALLALGGFLSVFVLGGGCASETSDGSGGTGTTAATGPSTASGGPKCYSVAVNQSNDGSTACDSQVCPGGKFCLGAGICDPGCKSELNCPMGQYCDKAANPDVGLCRVPSAAMEVPCSGPATGVTTGAMDCTSRCLAKSASCDIPPAQANPGCQMICPGLSETQLDCLEKATCAELKGIGEGKPICGIGM